MEARWRARGRSPRGGASGPGTAPPGPARSTATSPSGMPFASRSRTNARFASGACERMSVAMRRTSIPDCRAAAADAAPDRLDDLPPGQAPGPCGAAAPSGPRRSARCRAALSSTRSAAIRSSASASCISAIGRSNAASSSAWSVDLVRRRRARRACRRRSSAPRCRGSARCRARCRYGASRRGGGGARPSASRGRARGRCAGRGRSWRDGRWLRVRGEYRAISR